MWQNGLQLEIDAAVQSMCGLWARNQGSPSTTGEQGEGMTSSRISSLWLPEIVRVMGDGSRLIRSQCGGSTGARQGGEIVPPVIRQ